MRNEQRSPTDSAESGGGGGGGGGEEPERCQKLRQQL